ncbi:MAG: hypothetical protein JWN62_1465 [Acidimicrobiales bacterium]|nr:hypothetical protein [Acidimicrobiales bacterium]
MADFLIGGQIDPAKHERVGTTTSIASGDLTTHGVIVGMTGSGKTGLGIVLIEDALRAGVPTLLIDPKGDLTNLCLTFPNLAAADFEPWVNEGDAQKAGQTVADFAAAQAKAWTDGLAGWSLGAADIAALRTNVELTIYTPGSSAGVGVNIVGSLRAPTDASDPEIVGDEIDGFVSGLLGLVGIDADPLTSREHILLSNLILNEWTAGRSLDIAALIGLVQTPTIRKLGVFELDSFFPPKDRTEFALRLNGLLASPSFGAWLTGAPLDIASMLHTADGRPRCAIVSIAHLDDQERQFVTTLVLSKLVTWMRRQSGTTDLRALVYMDEVAGYLPPTAMPPTKKPIMTLMKQARAFGVGVVLSTQNPVDIDYKAISNAGTWMIGRLQTDRDKQRLLDGMSAAAGGVDVGAVGDTIGGLAKREFVLRRAGKDQPEVFTTRWAMSYLRGPLTRDQISTLMADQRGAAAATSAAAAPANAEPTVAGAATAAPAVVPTPTATAPPALGAGELGAMPTIAGGVAVRWADPAAPWLSTVGGDPRGVRSAAAIVARVTLRYDDTKADLVHDDEYETVLHPLGSQVDVTKAIGVDYDDRDLHDVAPVSCVYRLPDAPVDSKAFWTNVQRDLVDFLVRSKSMELLTNAALKLYSRPGETAADFAARCTQAADAKADAETAALRGKYQTKVTSIQNQIQTAQQRAETLHSQAESKRNEELLSTAGSILGGLFSGRKSRGGLLGSVLGKAGTAAGRMSTAGAAGDRADAASNKVGTLNDQLQELESELAREVTEIDARWRSAAENVTTTTIPLERADVKVTQLTLAWLPVAAT